MISFTAAQGPRDSPASHDPPGFFHPRFLQAVTGGYRLVDPARG